MSTLKWLPRKYSRKNKRIAVYTAISGDYDELKNPIYINENCDYICFTDNEYLKSDYWEIRIMEDSYLDQVRKARKYKVLPHKYFPDYDYSIWVDGGFEIIGDLQEYIDKFSEGNSMICIIHPERNCVYAEAMACIDFNKDSEDVIVKQMEKYRLEKYPDNNGMIASGILFRKHNDPNVIMVMDDWWKEIKAHSRRDQLSFNYVCWKNSFTYDICDLSYWENEYFKYVGHRDAPEHDQVNIQVFWPVKGIYSETNSNSVKVIVDGKTHNYVLNLPSNIKGPLRLDPINATAYIRIDSIELMSKQQRLTYWYAQEKADGLLIRSGILIKKDRYGYHLLITGNDPNIILDYESDDLEIGQDDNSLSLNIRMQVERNISSSLIKIMETEKDAYRKALDDKTCQIEAISANLSNKEEDIKKLTTNLSSKEEDIRKLVANLEAIEGSFGWKLICFYRKLAGVVCQVFCALPLRNLLK